MKHRFIIFEKLLNFINTMTTIPIPTKIHTLLYSELGMFNQINGVNKQGGGLPNVKNPEKNWLPITPDYKTNGQLDEIGEAIEDIFTNINAGKPGIDTPKEYLWEYNTPKLQGLYLVVYDVNKRIVPQLENDILKVVTDLCAEFGFRVISDERNILNDTGLYQRIITDK